MKARFVPLRHVAEILVSNVDKKSVENEKPVRLVNYTDVYYNSDVGPLLPLMAATATDDQIRRFGLRAGDSIITKDSETANDIAVPTYVAESAPDMVCGYHLALVRPRDGIDARYLSWALKSDFVRGQFSAAANGMTRYGLTYDAIESASVPSPDIEAQRRIADFLDDQVARIDNIITARTQQLAMIQAVARSRMQDLFNESSARVRPLATLNDAHRPIQYGIVLPGPDYPGGVPIVKGGDVAAGRVRTGGLNRTDPKIEAKYARSRLQAGDLVISIRGSVGEVDVVPGALTGANLTQDAARIAPFGCDPDWLRWALELPSVQADMRRRITGAMVPGINIEALRSVRIPDTPPALQGALGQAARQCMQSARNHVEAFNRSNSLMAELKRSLITAAVTGEFDVSSADGSRVLIA